MCILLVEDNQMNGVMLSRRLTRECHRVLVATKGEQAVRMAVEEHSHVVLRDVDLPGFNGLEATRVLGRDPETARIRVIATTTHALESNQQEARTAGCNDFDTKPIGLERSVSKIAARTEQVGA